MIKTILANIAIFIGLVLAVLLVTAAFGDGYNLVRELFPKHDKRADLPAYEDHDRAQAVFREQRTGVKDYVPFVAWRHAPHAGATLTIDDNGRRRHTLGTDNDAGAVNLGMFGGSTVWGTGVDDNGTLPAQFDAITSAFAVTNYGERGYTTMQNLIDLMMLINTRQMPQVVVFFEGYNDVWVHCDGSVTHRLNGHMEEHRLQSALDRTAKENYLYNTIVAPIVDFVARISGAKQAAHEPLCSTDPVRAEAVAEMFVRTLEMAREVVTGNGGRFYAFLQPTAYVGNPDTKYLELGEQRDESLKAQFEAVYPLIIAKMETRGIGWFADLSHALDGDEAVLIDQVHVTAKGNALLARKMDEEMNAMAQ